MTTLYLYCNGGLVKTLVQGETEAARLPEVLPVRSPNPLLRVRLRPLVPLSLYGAAAGALTWVAIEYPLIAAAILYAGLFVSLAWRWPQVALAAIFALSPFQTTYPGVARSAFPSRRSICS